MITYLCMSATCGLACDALNIALSSLFLCDSPVTKVEILGGKKIIWTAMGKSRNLCKSTVVMRAMILPLIGSASGFKPLCGSTVASGKIGSVYAKDLQKGGERAQSVSTPTCPFCKRCTSLSSWGVQIKIYFFLQLKTTTWKQTYKTNCISGMIYSCGFVT